MSISKQASNIYHCGKSGHVVNSASSLKLPENFTFKNGSFVKKVEDCGSKIAVAKFK